jgi:CheY-like chemotaxis protein
VDDNEKIARDAAEIFESWKKESPGQFTADIETSLGRAADRLAKERFDLVTLDLHDAKDPDPEKEDVAASTQAGEKATRFVPVIFYTGFAAKLSGLESPIIKVVTKGRDDVNALRGAASEIFATKLPRLVRSIESEQRSFMWDTLSNQWPQYRNEISPEEMAYLLARRVAQQLSRETIKTVMEHAREDARPIEMYVYPPPNDELLPGDIVADKTGQLWIVVTPACDFAQGKAENVLMCAIGPLNTHPIYVEWQNANSAKNKEKAEGKLRNLLRNGGGDRWRFLPKTFFVGAGVVDFQRLQQMPLKETDGLKRICALDSPYSEELLLAFSRYYGRIGTPDLKRDEIWQWVTELAATSTVAAVEAK